MEACGCVLTGMSVHTVWESVRKLSLGISVDNYDVFTLLQILICELFLVRRGHSTSVGSIERFNLKYCAGA